jgi:hypothetical protein
VEPVLRGRRPDAKPVRLQSGRMQREPRRGERQARRLGLRKQRLPEQLHESQKEPES